MSLLCLAALAVLNVFMTACMYMLMVGPPLAVQDPTTGEWTRIKRRYRIAIIGSFVFWLFVTGKVVEQLWQHIHG